MGLNKANITWSCKQIAKMADNGTFSFDNIIQRSYVWEQTRKSGLIHSIIEGYPIPSFFAKKVDGKTYDFLDGKQRINAIRGFIDGEYYLTGVPEVTYMSDGVENTISLSGKYFNDLPEEIQDTIKDYHLVVYYYEDISPEQVRMLFAKLNNGKPLSTKERNIANCVDIHRITEIGKHALFTNTMTEKALETRKQLPIVMKMWMMLNENIVDVSFESKTFNEVMRNTEISDEEYDELIHTLDRAYAIYVALEDYENAKVAKATKKRMIAETHIVSLIPWIKRSIDENVSIGTMVEFMVYLFGNSIVSDAYADASSGGSAKNINVKRRNEEIGKKWDEFFTEYNNNVETTDDDVVKETTENIDDAVSMYNEIEEVDM